MGNARVHGRERLAFLSARERFSFFERERLVFSQPERLLFSAEERDFSSFLVRGRLVFSQPERLLFSAEERGFSQREMLFLGKRVACLFSAREAFLLCRR